jgi:glycosyltransferase involved in cell wall biosynthesis
MMMGGSTTSLLSILNNIDYSKFSVDLALIYNKGEYFQNIPSEVNLLPPIYKYQHKVIRNLRRYTSLKYIATKIKSKMLMRKYDFWYGLRYLENKDVDFERDIGKQYDVAIGFMEGWSNIYILKHVKAQRKIGWIHSDYIKSGFHPELDYSTFASLDNIVLVSQECLKSFNQFFPDYQHKTMVIENILSNERIKSLASEDVNDFQIDTGNTNFVTVCRIDFKSKGLDRVIQILSDHLREQVFEKLRWYIIGNGPDFDALSELIEANRLQDKVILLGQKINPFPYMKNMDMFLLPSRYEGKPMAITEAMMLGIPPLVTNYTSAAEQIKCGKDGIIVDNTEEAIYQGLKNMLEHPKIISELKANLCIQDYSNISEMEKVNKLLER